MTADTVEDVWTIKAALDWTADYLARKGDQVALRSSQWLISEATGLSRVELYANFDRPLSMHERDVLRSYVKRRAYGEPLQYITGEVGFRHVSVKVRPGVLIPRPETEVLVSEALALLPPRLRPDEEGPSPRLHVIDLCTGTGCVACAIASEDLRTHIVATDCAPEAVALARENSEILGIADRISVIECDLGAGMPESQLGSFDLVVANPPYVPHELMVQLSREVVAFEPKLALDGGDDGLSIFRRILPFALRALTCGGGLAVELHEESLDQACELARKTGFVDVRVVADLTGRSRVLTARTMRKETK